ncbi:MAG: dockerin type I repeat-containing protein, partial [Oscillospiraceae bacterium]|nr:dockerin type I repeat-containing protein [Oscillospiraceae bacterium]
PGSDTFVPYQPAITTYVYHHEDWDENIYSFDTENHSLYIRCRYYMEWEPVVMGEYGEEPGEKQSKFSDWSESAVFGKNSTQIIPEEPTVYEAPIVSDLKIILPNEIYYDTHLEYIQTTPESVWLANIYYMMTGDGYFDGLETQVSINGGEWISFDTADSWGDWCLWNGSRGAYNDDVIMDENTNVRLRIRFNGSHGPSPWSNIAEVNEVVGNDIIYGDVDGNKKVNVLDANLIRRYAAKIIGFDSKQLIAGDVDGNGKVNVLDANLVRRHAAKLINSFPVEN